MNPLTLEDLISNPPYCLLYKSSDVTSEFGIGSTNNS